MEGQFSDCAVERDVVIVAGFGFRGAASVDSLRDALAATGAKPDLLATVAAKSNHVAFTELARDCGLPVSATPPETLTVQATQTRSAASNREHGTGSVAEASALAAAGPGARLLGPRHVSADRLATCAIAIGETS